MLKILIADDHPIMRDGLRQILSASADIVIAAEAGSGDEVMARLKQEDFDVLVLDLSMPGISGIELIKRVVLEKPKQHILILSMHKEELYAVRTLKAGASGYLCKDSASGQLIPAIRKVASGGRFVSPEVAESLAMEVSPQHHNLPHTQFSDREFQIFRMIAAGRSITEIAETLMLSVKTVSTYKTRILEKLHL
ncbi:MAG: DNA-binding response regulator, partial [Rhodocyclaceae bacterium]